MCKCFEDVFLKGYHFCYQMLSRTTQKAYKNEIQDSKMLYVFFWVIPQHLNFICPRFGTLCSIFTGKYEDGTDRVLGNVII